jgi:pimeloyl-ACP methyl ester carboxylesterase
MTANLPPRRVRRFRSMAPHESRAPSVFAVASVAVGAFIAMAAVNRILAQNAEEKNPATGRFVDVDGVRLHYVERGAGDPIVLLHGNGSMVEDFDCSGLMDLASGNHRVIAFDRPGFGHSERPRNVVWTPDAQAKLLRRALDEIGVSEPVVLGHSWGASVAVAMGHQFPTFVRGLVLASGYYYPTPRTDAVASIPTSLPLLGDLPSNTLAPLLGRIAWPLTLAKMFGPMPVPDKFRGFPRELALRPHQLRAAAAESVLMVPDALMARSRYAELKMPVVIIAGDLDRVVDWESQSARLHTEIAQSSFHRLRGHGHMVHQTATEEVASALREVSSKSVAIAAE